MQSAGSKASVNGPRASLSAAVVVESHCCTNRCFIWFARVRTGSGRVRFPSVNELSMVAEWVVWWERGRKGRQASSGEVFIYSFLFLQRHL